MSHCITENRRSWVPQVIAQSCSITIETETSKEGFSVNPKTPLRHLAKGSLLTMTGGDDARYFFRLGDEKGEKVSANRAELNKVFVED